MGDRVDDHGMVHSCEWTDAYGNHWSFPPDVAIGEFALNEQENAELKELILSFLDEDAACNFLLEMMAGGFFVINARAMRALMRGTALVARTTVEDLKKP